MVGWPKAPPSLADAFMRDPVGALSPRRPTAECGGRRAASSPTPTSRWRRGAPGCCCSTRRTHTPSGPPSSYVSGGAHAALYARRRLRLRLLRHDGGAAGLGRARRASFRRSGRGDGARAVFEARAAPRPRVDGAFAQLMFLDDDAGIGAVPDARARRSAGGAPSALCARDGVGAADLAGRRTPSGEPVAKALYYDQYAGAEALRAAQPACSSRRSPTSGTSLGCAARARRRAPIHGWADDCALNSGVVLAGTCAGARRLLEAWLGLAPRARRSARAPPSSASRASATTWRRPVDAAPLLPVHDALQGRVRAQPLLEEPHLGEAIVVDDPSSTGPTRGTCATCGAAGTAAATAARRSDLIPEWYDGPRDAEALRAMIPPPVAWRQRRREWYSRVTRGGPVSLGVTFSREFKQARREGARAAALRAALAFRRRPSVRGVGGRRIRGQSDARGRHAARRLAHVVT